MPELSKSYQIALALALPASVVVAYWIYSRWSSDEECYGKEKVVTSHNTPIKVQVPAKAVGTIIGRHGATIKQIQAESGARLHFDSRSENEDGKPRVLLISGKPELAQNAEMMVYKVIADMPIILKEEIQVPQFCVGKIIGKGGCIVRDIRRASGAKIDISKNQGEGGADKMTPIVLTGSREQINLAMELIDEIVKEIGVDKRDERKSNFALDCYVPQEATTVKTTAVPVEEEDDWDPFLDDEDYDGMVKKTSDNSSGVPLSEDFFQVMVSAVEHPGHFWVQMVGPKSLHLEQLQNDMTQQLSSCTVRQSLSVCDPKPGVMVAAKFETEDPVYYRAQVLARTEDGRVDLYFVDYGDNAYADVGSIYTLRPEFLPFPHQAVHCQLAGVEPLTLNGDKWTEESITMFEDLTHCARWKPLYARTLTHARVQGHLGQGEGHESLRPCLQLIDTSNDKDVDIAEELIRHGQARKSAVHDDVSNPPSKAHTALAAHS